MDALESVVTVPTLGLSLCIAIFTLLTRRFVEIVFPSLSKKTEPTKEQQFWEKLILPSFPIALGLGFCLLVSPAHFDYPELVLKSAIARSMYGIVTGWFATWTYSIATFLIMRKWNIPSPDGDVKSPRDSLKDIEMPQNSPPSD